MPDPQKSYVRFIGDLLGKTLIFDTPVGLTGFFAVTLVFVYYQYIIHFPLSVVINSFGRVPVPYTGSIEKLTSRLDQDQ